MFLLGLVFILCTSCSTECWLDLVNELKLLVLEGLVKRPLLLFQDVHKVSSVRAAPLTSHLENERVSLKKSPRERQVLPLIR